MLRDYSVLVTLCKISVLSISWHEKFSCIPAKTDLLLQAGVVVRTSVMKVLRPYQADYV